MIESNMLKPLLVILTIVSIIALALNFDFYSDSTKIKKTPLSTNIEEKNIVHQEKKFTETNTTHELIVDNNLSKELTALLLKAQKLFQSNQDDNALLIYEEVISKSQKSKEINILKLFAKACFQKASIYYAYPRYDIASAVESYELIVENFKNKYNKELLLTYMVARLQKTQLTSNDELLLTYDELIEKFENDKEERFEKEIEEMLFAKSFALMGVDDEEAIEVLDSIIAKYANKTNLPENVKFSILNNIELSIITSNDSEKYVDLANQHMSNSPDTKPLLDMLNIIKNAQDLEQGEALEKWNSEHNEYLFPEWDFSELRKWANNMEVPERQKRIRKYLNIFEKQKYQNIYQTAEVTGPTTPIYSDKAIENTTHYEEIPTYETPY